ncbi:hypothetical protein ABIE27_002005 [Paenibacillus sp. 4624]|uniref:hypothetical protein n=1 Tax=Paenibacillus sp. 4624 TaxID=3156453 RepID=UPI003D1BA9E2
MIKDLLLAENKQYEVCLVFEDNSKYIGTIEMSSDKKRVKIKHQNGVEWIPLEEIRNCSLSVPFLNVEK